MPMTDSDDAWHAEDAVAYLRGHADAGVIGDPAHGWWVTTQINDERHPFAFRIKDAEADRVREHPALERLDPNPHPGREVWILRRMT